MWLKKLFMPTGANKQVNAIQSWKVEWWSKGLMYQTHDYHVEIFTDPILAKEYADRVNDAFEFCRQKHYVKAEVKENNEAK